MPPTNEDGTSETTVPVEPAHLPPLVTNEEGGTPHPAPATDAPAEEGMSLADQAATLEAAQAPPSAEALAAGEAGPDNSVGDDPGDLQNGSESDPVPDESATEPNGDPAGQ